jgi:hypothetical protein
MPESALGCDPHLTELSDEDLERVAAGESDYIMPRPDDP